MRSLFGTSSISSRAVFLFPTTSSEKHLLVSCYVQHYYTFFFSIIYFCFTQKPLTRQKIYFDPEFSSTFFWEGILKPFLYAKKALSFISFYRLLKYPKAAIKSKTWLLLNYIFGKSRCGLII